ncbi:MAG: tetratricopeptide repeat protein [Nostocaceae cyanobacterium]|nr:tetratricopeptide repeat protein [Nostocaceae cyanobacterium]
MNRCYQIFLNFTIAVGLTIFLSFLLLFSNLFIAASAQEESSLTTEILPQDWLRSAEQKIDTGKHQEAISDLNQAILLQPDSALAYRYLCFAYIQIGDYHNAVTHCNQAIQISPQNSENYLHRGLAHYRLGEHQAAIADNTAAIQLKPFDFRAHYNRGLASSSLGNPIAAIADYNQALSLIPDDKSIFLADIYNDRGLARLELQDLEAASRDFSLAIRLNDNDFRGYYNRGCACQRKGDPVSALHDFTYALRLNPVNAQAYINRGLVRHRLGYHQAALTDLHKAYQCFGHQGDRIAQQSILDLIEKIQQRVRSGNLISTHLYQLLLIFG